METFTLEAEAGQVSSELARLGIEQATRVVVVVRVPDRVDPLPPMAAIAESGRAFEWLSDEPDLYTDADLLPRGS